jgi:putative membrane protein
MFHGFQGHGWGMSWGWIIGLIILIAAIWLIIKSIQQNKASADTHRSALDILKERYAKGEIDKNEFEEKKKDLM